MGENGFCSISIPGNHVLENDSDDHNLGKNSYQKFESFLVLKRIWLALIELQIQYNPLQFLPLDH